MLFLCLCLCVTYSYGAKTPPEYGQPIPEEAWQVTNDPTLGIQDAAYLMYYTQFNSTYVKHYRLIRILSEQGKSAAEFAAESRWLNVNA